MNDLKKQVGLALEQSQALMNVSEAKEMVTTFLDWIGKEVLKNEKTTNEKLLLIKQSKANTELINELTGNIEQEIENDKELQKKMTEKIDEIKKLSKETGVQVTESNEITVTGNNRIIMTDVNSNNFTINIKSSDD